VNKPGTYWLLAEPLGGRELVHAVGNVDVLSEDPVPGIGGRAPGVGDADTCERGRRRGAGDDSYSARHLAVALLRRPAVAREDPVRRDVRDAQVL